MKKKKPLLCKLGLHNYEQVIESAYSPPNTFNQFGFPIVYVDKVCLVCGHVNNRAQREKANDTIVLKKKSDNKLKAKKIWFESLSDEKKAEVFADWLDK